MSSPSSPRSVHFTAYTLARYAFWACNRPLHHIPTRWPLNWTNHDPHKPCRPSSCRRLRFAREKKEFEYLISNYAAWLWLLRDYPLPPFSPPPCLTGPSPTLQLFLEDPLSPSLQPPRWRIPELVELYLVKYSQLVPLGFFTGFIRMLKVVTDPFL